MERSEIETSLKITSSVRALPSGPPLRCARVGMGKPPRPAGTPPEEGNAHSAGLLTFDFKTSNLIADFHSLYQAIGNSINMLYIAVEQLSTIKGFDYLMHGYLKAAVGQFSNANGFYGRVYFAPLAGPVLAYLVVAGYKVAFKGFWPAHIGAHGGKGGVYIAAVKGGVGGGDEGVWHGGGVFVSLLRFLYDSKNNLILKYFIDFLINILE